MKNLLEKIRQVLDNDERVVFAYLYGSALEGKDYRDIDIGIYLRGEENVFSVTGEIQILLSKKTGLSPDLFDVQPLNMTDNLIYLSRVLNGELLVDKDYLIRAEFIEDFSMRYREAEGILAEAFS